MQSKEVKYVSLVGLFPDGIENLGPATTGQEYLTVDINKRELKPFAHKLLDVWYSTPAFSGVYPYVELPSSKFRGITGIQDYRPRE